MAKATLRRASSNIWTVGWCLLILLIAAFGLRDWTGFTDADEGLQPSGRLTAVDDSEAAGGASLHQQRPEKFSVTIRRPAGPPSIEFQPPDSLGRVARVACSTCHSVRAPNLENRTPADLKQFHQDMPLAHGRLACYACHNPDDSDTLRRADGTLVEYADVMNLCAQCHGTQANSYAHGVHGGMTGYWDLGRGGRVRNNCIDCHDPHVPRFPEMQPTFKPRDRFLTPPIHQLHHDETDEKEVDLERTDA